ncbi:MAG: flavodoxin [Streptococcaceae bacterium]|jgi:flavodoxin short chain|nr:flavodoxin [Streptococcaceae bacterium]
MAKVEIVYCSMTGNTEACAEIVYEKFQELGVDVEIHDCTTVDPDDVFEDCELCIVGTYTYGEGDMPDEILDFYEEMQGMDLSGKLFGCFGSGDTFYEEYCRNVEDFDRAFEACGATRGAELVKVELYPEDEDKANLEAFAVELASKL